MTSHVYIIQNQDKLLLGRQRQWLDGREPGALYKTPHKDEAVNEMFEINIRDFSQRMTLVHCPLNDRGQPQLDPATLPPPLPHPAKHPPPEGAEDESTSPASEHTDS